MVRYVEFPAGRTTTSRIAERVGGSGSTAVHCVRTHWSAQDYIDDRRLERVAHTECAAGVRLADPELFSILECQAPKGVKGALA
jgi:hypothetical protein